MTHLRGAAAGQLRQLRAAHQHALQPLAVVRRQPRVLPERADGRQHRVGLGGGRRRGLPVRTIGQPPLRC
jgi:hypothetical protein